MAEIVMERFTRCPTGNPADEVVFEVVVADDDARRWDSPIARTTTLARLFTRGSLVALGARKRDILITTARGALRTIRLAARLDASHRDVDLTPLGITLTFPMVRGVPLPFDFYGGPAQGVAEPTPATLFDTYKVRARA